MSVKCECEQSFQKNFETRSCDLKTYNVRADSRLCLQSSVSGTRRELVHCFYRPFWRTERFVWLFDEFTTLEEMSTT